jgi:hypothetical protein
MHFFAYWDAHLYGHRIVSPQTDAARVIDRKRIDKPDTEAEAPLKPGTEPHETWWACGSNYFNANAHIFNDPAYVTRNNCYCFASNHIANSRYALPGRRGGNPATSITCGGVIWRSPSRWLERRL